jgi:assimilatory nitrate reductase catalytic subunit
MENGVVSSVKGNPDYPINLGYACIKGLQFLGHLNAPDRATIPYLRDKNGKLQRSTWEEALEAFTTNFKNIQHKYGQNSVSFISTGQMVNEEFALLGALTKFGMGLLHGDGNTRQCMASAVVAYKQSFGFDAPPYSYKDFEESDVMVFLGSNPMVAHPLMWTRVMKNRKNPRIFIIDPRKTKTARSSRVIHLAIQPKTDIILLYGLANILIKNNWVNSKFIERHTRGYEGFETHVSEFTIDYVSRNTGLSIKQIRDLAEAIHEGHRVSFWWMVGINQGHQAVRTAQAIINLALMTGNIGRCGTGANSITGQCNAMGSRLFSNTSSLFCGYDFTNPEHRKKISGLIDIDESYIPKEPSWAYDKILEKIEDGTIKGLWVICTNPVHSWIDNRSLTETFKKLDYLVVQDMFFNTVTAELADLILPAAGCGEKDGTFINSERRFGIVKKILDPPGEALPNFEIFHKIAEAWGCNQVLEKWNTPHEVFQIMKEISKGQPCDFSGIKDYDMLVNHGGIQWPFQEDSTYVASERLLFENGAFYHSDEKAVFLFEDVAEVPEKTNFEYPFILITGRGSVAQYHTLTRTGKVSFLRKISENAPYIEINPLDANEKSIQDNEDVIVSSKRGKVRVKAKISETVQPKQVFMPMHFIETNVLTYPGFDPYSRQPSFKFSAVKIEKTPF